MRPGTGPEYPVVLDTVDDVIDFDTVLGHFDRIVGAEPFRQLRTEFRNETMVRPDVDNYLGVKASPDYPLTAEAYTIAMDACARIRRMRRRNDWSINKGRARRFQKKLRQNSAG